MLEYYPDRTGYVHMGRDADANLSGYTGIYVRRKQLLLSVQSAILPRYGFDAHQGGSMGMIGAVQQMVGVGDSRIDELSAEANAEVAPLYAS